MDLHSVRVVNKILHNIMSAMFIILFSIILLIILVWIGINNREGFESKIDSSVKYDKIEKYLTDFSNNFINDCNNSIEFIINDPSGVFIPTSPNYSGMSSIGNYHYEYGQAGHPKNYAGIIPSISFSYKNDFAVLYNDVSFSPIDISGVDQNKSTKSFIAMVNLCTELDSKIKQMKKMDMSSFSIEQIHEYNMLVFTYVVFEDITKAFAISGGILDSIPIVYGEEVLQKYGIISDHIVNGLNQKIPAILYYVMPYYDNSTYNIPPPDVVTGITLNPDSIFTIEGVKYDLLPYCYYEGIQSVRAQPIAQAIFTKFNY